MIVVKCAAFLCRKKNEEEVEKEFPYGSNKMTVENSNNTQEEKKEREREREE